MHTTLAYITLGALSLGLAIELLSRRVIGRRGFRSAGRWLVVIGALTCVPAATTGIHAYYDVVRNAGGDESAAGARPWYQLVRDATPHLPDERWAGLARHAWRMAGGTALVLVAVLPILGGSDQVRRRWYWPGLLLLLVSAGVIGWEAWSLSRAPADHAGGTMRAVQLHTTLAGLMIAVAWAARAAAAARPAHRANLWASVAVIVIATAAVGASVGGLYGNWERTKAVLAQPRNLMHAALGTSIIVLTMTLGTLTRRARRRRRMIRATGALLLAALAVQIAMGTLLLFDGSDRGAPLWRFRPPTVQRPTSLDTD